MIMNVRFLKLRFSFNVRALTSKLDERSGINQVLFCLESLAGKSGNLTTSHSDEDVSSSVFSLNTVILHYCLLMDDSALSVDSSKVKGSLHVAEVRLQLSHCTMFHVFAFQNISSWVPLVVHETHLKSNYSGSFIHPSRHQPIKCAHASLLAPQVVTQFAPQICNITTYNTACLYLFIL